MKTFKQVVVALSVLIFPLAAHAQEALQELHSLNDYLADSLNNMPAATSEIEESFDQALGLLQETIEQLTSGDMDLETINIADQLTVIEVIAKGIGKSLPNEFSQNMDDIDMGNFDEAEQTMIMDVMQGMKKVKLEKIEALNSGIINIEDAGINITGMITDLNSIYDAPLISIDFSKDLNISNLDMESATAIGGDLAKISESFDTLDQNLGDVSGSIGEVSENISEVSESIAEVSENISEVSGSISEVSESVAEVTESISEVTESIAEAATEVAEQAVEAVEEVAEEVQEPEAGIPVEFIDHGAGLPGDVYYPPGD